MKAAIAVSVLLSGVLLVVVPSRADDDHEGARRAVEAGEIVPLRQILDRAQADHPGEFVGARLENEHDRRIYEIRLMTPDGHILKLHYDARDGRPLGEEREGERGHHER